MSGAKHVVIVGGGFAGLEAARRLGGAPVRVTLLDRRNFHLFQPLLYQVATGGLSPANIASPLRRILRRYRNVHVLMHEVAGFDLARKFVLVDSSQIAYDWLIVAAGVSHNYFGHPEWASVAPGLKTIEDATEIRSRVLSAFELAEKERDAARRKSLLTFIVVGAGPTGVELAGALAEIARDTLRHDFRSIDPAESKIILLDAASRVLPTYPPELSQKAEEALSRLGVTVRTGCPVVDLSEGRLVVRSGGAGEEIAARTVLWAAGVQASPLGKALAQAAGCETDRAGRVLVTDRLSVPGHPEVFVIGDLASVTVEGKPVPGIAPAAIQQGRYVARLIRDQLAGRTTPPFRYKDRGSMATIGRAAAVADLGRVKLSGYPAWLAWLFVHLIFLVEFQNKLLVLVQWAWNYFTRNRAARLITGEPAETLTKPGS